MFFEERGGSRADAAAEFGGREDFHVGAAGEDATLDVVEVIQTETRSEAAVRPLVELLRGVHGRSRR